MSYIVSGGLGRTWAMVALRDDGDHGHPTQYQSATPSTNASAMIMAMKQMAMMNDMYVHIALGETCRALHQQLQMGLTTARNFSNVFFHLCLPWWHVWSVRRLWPGKVFAKKEAVSTLRRICLRGLRGAYKSMDMCAMRSPTRHS